MTVRDMIDRMIAGIQSGELRGSDPVSTDLLQEDNLSVAEYMAGKYKIERGSEQNDKGKAIE